MNNFLVVTLCIVILILGFFLYRLHILNDFLIDQKQYIIKAAADKLKLLSDEIEYLSNLESKIVIKKCPMCGGEVHTKVNEYKPVILNGYCNSCSIYLTFEKIGEL